MPHLGRARARRIAVDATGRSALSGAPPPVSGGYRHRAFGLGWRSDIPLDGFAVDTRPESKADVDVRIVDRLPQRVATGRVHRSTIHADGVRFWRDRAIIFDLVDGTRIDCLPGPGWSGRMPLLFHATVAALTLAWRGAVPMHASAVAIEGRGILLCGASGAGKSTLTASLIARGARFIGDDLSALWRGADGWPVIATGRPTMRLHAETAGWIDATGRRPDESDGRGKWRVEPQPQQDRTAVPLAAIIMVGGGTAGDLPRHLFRPRWMAALPDHDRRMAMLDHCAKDVPVIALPPVAISTRADFDTLGRATMAKIVAAIG